MHDSVACMRKKCDVSICMVTTIFSVNLVVFIQRESQFCCALMIKHRHEYLRVKNHFRAHRYCKSLIFSVPLYLANLAFLT